MTDDQIRTMRDRAAQMVRDYEGDTTNDHEDVYQVAKFAVEMADEILRLTKEEALAAFDRTRRDRSTILRMAGNIAGGAMSTPGTYNSETVAKAAVIVARAIIAEVDHG